MFKRFKNLKLRMPVLAAICGAVWQWSCGAPLKSADDVEDLFSESRTLEGKVLGLCEILRTRTEAPTLGNFRMSDEICAKPGRNYMNYSSLGPEEALTFSAVRTNSEAGSDKSEPIFNMQTRSELFLNRSVLELAKSLLSTLDKKSDKVQEKGGTADSKDSKFSMEFIGEPVFDAKTFTFQLEFRMRSSKAQNGQVDIDNVYKVVGRLFDKESIAVDIATKDIGDVNRTIIKNGKIVLFIIPHAGDIYMDIGTDINYHSFGVDEVMKQSIKSTLGAGLRTLPELVADAHKK